MNRLLSRKALVSKDLIYPGMFDLPRGVFMLMVLVWHSAMLLFHLERYASSNIRMVHMVGFVNNLIFGGIIPMLFLCCGFGWRKRKMKKAISVHIPTLIKPYCVLAVLVTATMTVVGLLTGGDWLRILGLYAKGYLLGISPGWELGRKVMFPTYTWCVVAYFFASILVNGILHEKETWIQVAIVLILACIGVLMREKFNFLFIRQTLVCVGYMYVGWLMKKTDFLSKEIPVYFLGLLMLACAFMSYRGELTIANAVWKNGLLDVINGLFLGMIGLSILLNLNRLQGKITEVIRWIGREAFLVCCFHATPFQLALIWLVSRIGRITPYPIVDKLICVVICSVLNTLFAVGGAYLFTTLRKKRQRRKAAAV